MPAKSGKTGGKVKAPKAPKAPCVKGAKKGRRKAVRSWSLYIFKVLKQVHSDTGISNRAMSIMNSFINTIFDRLATEAGTHSALPSFIEYSISQRAHCMLSSRLQGSCGRSTRLRLSLPERFRLR